MTSHGQTSHQHSLTGRGYLVYYMLAVTIWGAEAVLTKMVLSDVLAPGAMLVLRVLITALVAALQLDLQNWFWLLSIGGISSGLAYVFYYKELQGSNVVMASVATLLGPVIGVTLSVLLLHESFTAVQVAGIAGLLVTVYFLSTSNLWPDGQTVAAGQVDENVQQTTRH